MPELAMLHGTDKWGMHRYADHYDRHLHHLRDQQFSLFEIGIGGADKAGASLRMWRDFFPHAQVIGLDINDRLSVRADRIHPYIGSQVDPAVLDRIFADFGDIRVIVDDGSHRPEHIRETFALLFPRLPAGAIYIIEDTQTSYWPSWGGSKDLDADDTTMALAKSLIDGLNWEEWAPAGYEPSYTDLNVRAVHCYHNLVIVEKGENHEGTGRAMYEAGDPGLYEQMSEASTGSAEPHAASRRSPVSDLTPWSETFLVCVFAPSEPAVNLVLLDEPSPGGIFAGVKTALEVAVMLAEPEQRRIRLITLNPGNGSAEMASWLADRFPGVQWEVVAHAAIDGTTFGTDDLWLATHWVTAHALDIAVRSGRLDASDVIYLIQDFEPGFIGWSTLSALAESSYAAGFTPLVNARPVADLLASRGFGEVPAELVFSPAFDLEELRAAAERRTAHERPTVYFYGRPSKPRNMFDLGIAALRLAAERLHERGVTARFVMAGEDGPDIDLGPAMLENRGALSRPDYFALLSEIDIGLCLQASPHPGHAAFDVAISGGAAVTNELSGARAGSHAAITAVPARLENLADAIVARVLEHDKDSVGHFAAPNDQLGSSLTDATAAAWARYRDAAAGRWHRNRNVELQAVRSRLRQSKGHAPQRWAIKTSVPQGPIGDVWGDLFFAQDLAGALRHLGHEVFVDRLHERVRPDERPDDVALSLRGNQPTALTSGALNLTWIISHPEDVRLYELTRAADLVFAASIDWAARFGAECGIHIEPLLQATNPERFRPGAVVEGLRTDVLFVGKSRLVYRPIVRDAIAVGANLTVFGDEWDSFIAPHYVRARFIPNEALPDAYRSARLVLNDHWEDMRSDGFLSNRLFDAAATGACVITDDIGVHAELFHGLVRSYRDTDELARLIDDVEGWPSTERRQSIAEQIGREHSFAQRAEVLDRAVSAALGLDSR
jgi:hypothetical protein